MKNPIPTKLSFFGRDLAVSGQKVAGAVIILAVIISQTVNRGGLSQIPLPDGVDAKIKADLGAIAEESKEAAVQATQFNGTLPEDVDEKAIGDGAETAMTAANGLSVGGQLLILALVNERKDQFLTEYEKQKNNPKNEQCYAVKWTHGNCLKSMLRNRMIGWEAAKSTPVTSDDIEVAFEQLAFALATQEIIGTSLDVDAPLPAYYNQQLKTGNLKINRESAYAQLSNLMGVLGTSLTTLQEANNGALDAISGKTNSECFGVINAETLKACGGVPDAPEN